MNNTMNLQDVVTSVYNMYIATTSESRPITCRHTDVLCSTSICIIATIMSLWLCLLQCCALQQEFRQRLDGLPNDEFYRGFVTWSALEDALKGLRQQYENLPRSEQEIVEKDMVEVGNQTDLVSGWFYCSNFFKKFPEIFSVHVETRETCLMSIG